MVTWAASSKIDTNYNQLYSVVWSQWYIMLSAFNLNAAFCFGISFRLHPVIHFLYDYLALCKLCTVHIMCRRYEEAKVCKIVMSLYQIHCNFNVRDEKKMLLNELVDVFGSVHICVASFLWHDLHTHHKRCPWVKLYLTYTTTTLKQHAVLPYEPLAVFPLATISHALPRWPAELHKITIWQRPPCLHYCKWIIN